MPKMWFVLLLAGLAAGGFYPAQAQSIQITRIGSLGGARPSTVASQDRLAVLGLGTQLLVFDTPQSGSPRLLSRMDIGSEIKQVIFTQNRLWAVCTLGSTIHLLDMADPARPRRRGVIRPSISVDDMAGSGALLGVCNISPQSKFVLLDLADPDHPVERGGMAMASSHIALSGNLALLGREGSSLPPAVRVIDITQPDKPVLRATVAFGASSQTINDMAIAGSNLYVGTASSLYHIDLAQPDQPVAQCAWSDPNHSVTRIALAGSRAYALGNSMCVLNLVTPSSATLLGSVRVPQPIQEIAPIGGDTVMVASGSAGLLALDVRDPAMPSLTGGYFVPGDVRGVAVHGATAWLANGSGGLMSVNIGNPANPRAEKLLPYDPAFISAYPVKELNWEFDAVEVRNGLAHFAAWFGFGIIDIADPASPHQKGLFLFDSSNSGLSLGGKYAILSGTSARTWLCPLRIMNVEAPASPTLSGQLATTDYGIPDAVIHGQLIYHLEIAPAPNDCYLSIIELGSPGQSLIKQRGRLLIKNVGYHLALKWPYLYTAKDNGFTIVNVSNPDAPAAISQIQLPTTGGVNCMTIHSSLLFAASGGGVYAYDLSDPSLPRRCGSYQIEGENPCIKDIQADDSHIYLAAWPRGFELLRYESHMNSAYNWRHYR